MLLTPFWRAFCFVLAGGGILQLVFEFVCWRLAPCVGPTSNTSSRTLERRLLAFTLGARMLPWVIAAGLLMPAYLRAEDNANAERVSALCVLAGLAVAAWIAATLARASVLSWRTRLICDACDPEGRTVCARSVFLHRGSKALIAVMGTFRPRLLLSEGLLRDKQISTSALEVALDHESAHAVQMDNLKLLLLALLPSFSFISAARPSLADRWRLAAELAADAESTGGDSERSFLLAELLVQLARRNSFQSTPRLATLLSAPRHLAIRVDHLLQPSQTSASQHRNQNFLRVSVACAAISAFAVIYLSLAFGHTAAEHLLHFGF